MSRFAKRDGREQRLRIPFVAGRGKKITATDMDGARHPPPAMMERQYYRGRQVKTEDIAKFHTEPTTAPATPASHQVWLEVNA